MSDQASVFASKLTDKNNDDVKRRKAYQELRQFLGLDFLELTPEQADAFLDGFNEPIRKALESQDASSIKGAILAIECIVSLESKNKITRLNRFANYIKNILKLRQLPVLEPVACALCRICVHALAFTTEMVNDQITRSIEWMRDGNFNQLAALFILRELAQSAPQHFFLHAQSFFDGIFEPLRHRDPEVREAAGAALFAAFCVLAEREVRDRESVSPFWRLCVDELGKPQDKNPAEDKMHGPLLIVLQLLRLANSHFDLQWRQHESFAANFSLSLNRRVGHLDGVGSIISLAQSETWSGHDDIMSSVNEWKQPGSNGISELQPYPESRSCRRFIGDNFTNLSNFVLQSMTHKPATIQRAILQILPRLAAFSSQAFRPQLERAVTHMSNLAKKGEPSVKPNALTAIAMLILAAKTEICKFNDNSLISLPNGFLIFVMVSARKT